MLTRKYSDGGFRAKVDTELFIRRISPKLLLCKVRWHVVLRRLIGGLSVDSSRLCAYLNSTPCILGHLQYSLVALPDHITGAFFRVKGDTQVDCNLVQSLAGP